MNILKINLIGIFLLLKTSNHSSDHNRNPLLQNSEMFLKMWHTLRSSTPPHMYARLRSGLGQTLHCNHGGHNQLINSSQPAQKPEPKKKKNATLKLVQSGVSHFGWENGMFSICICIRRGSYIVFGVLQTSYTCDKTYSYFLRVT